MTRKAELRKEIIEILADCRYNSTKIETTEQSADKIIELTNAKWKQAIQKTLKELKEKTYLLISFHFDEIQKIIAKKEKGEIDINLDVLYKIHDNCLSDCRNISNQLDTTFKKNFGGLAE